MNHQIENVSTQAQSTNLLIVGLADTPTVTSLIVHVCVWREVVK